MARAARPVVGVGGVLIRRGRALLVRRGKEPLRGRWSIPGGAVERGETLEEALVREIREEAGLVVRPRGVIAVVDQIERAGGTVRHHYVIVDYLCEFVSGTPRAGSDAEAVAFVSAGELSRYQLTGKARELVSQALRRAARLRRARGRSRLLK